MNLNQVTIVGNLTRDPELKYTPKGTAIAAFSIAINRKFKIGEETREETQFIDCEAWGKTAEIISEYFKKGRPILICGRLKTETWEDKESGKKRKAMKVVAESFEFCGEGKSQSVPRTQPQPQEPNPETETHPDDVPF